LQDWQVTTKQPVTNNWFSGEFRPQFIQRRQLKNLREGVVNRATDRMVRHIVNCVEFRRCDTFIGWGWT
jgi:hypothetical protein